MKIYYLLLSLTLIWISCTEDQANDIVEYSDIVGVWMLPNEYLTNTDGSRIYREYWEFKDDGTAMGYIEQYAFDYVTGWSYTFTDRFLGDIYRIATCEDSDSKHYRKEVINMSWQRLLANGTTFDQLFLAPMGLISLSKDGDTLTYGECDLTDCYASGPMGSDECFVFTTKLIKVDDFEQRKKWYKYY